MTRNRHKTRKPSKPVVSSSVPTQPDWPYMVPEEGVSRLLTQTPQRTPLADWLAQKLRDAPIVDEKSNEDDPITFTDEDLVDAIRQTNGDAWYTKHHIDIEPDSDSSA